MVHPHNSGFAVRNFQKILHNEKDQSVDESGINNFPKKKLGQMDHFGPKNGACS